MPISTSRDEHPYAERAGREMPVTTLALDYWPNERVARHKHPVCQLIYAVSGVMVVGTPGAQWIVPPTRAVWVPAGIDHAIRMVGHVRMRTAYVRLDAASNLPNRCAVVAVSALLRELVLEAIAVKLPYSPDSRAGHLVRLLLDEIVQVPSLPLGLQIPTDRRLRIIHQTIARHPDDPTTASEWARKVSLDPRTIHRLFVRETGLTFGQWRQQARLLAALELIAQGETIVNVALAVGYRSPTAFATMFQRQLGTSPSRYFHPD